VSTAKTVLTNNATYSTAFSVVTGEKIYFLPSLLGTNTATATITYQYLTPGEISPSDDFDAIRLYSLRQLDTELPTAATTYVSAVYTAYGQTATAYHSFSNGTPVKTESTYKLLLPGDTITLTPTALTNSVRYRAITERQIR
jgi:archaellum component FlaF (FlaF/FlaG flagellin family)